MTYLKTILMYLGGVLLVNLAAFSYTTIAKAYEEDEDFIYQEINEWLEENPEEANEERVKPLVTNFTQ